MPDRLPATVETSGCRLTVFPPNETSTEGWYDFDAEIAAPGITARVLVPHLGQTSIARFFSSLEADWRGWQRVREWRSIEGQLAISATIDRAGHVSCVVNLQTRSGWGRGDWAASCTISIDSGEQLSRFVRDLNAIFS